MVEEGNISLYVSPTPPFDAVQYESHIEFSIKVLFAMILDLTSRKLFHIEV
jgi:hypothetical protein